MIRDVAHIQNFAPVARQAAAAPRTEAAQDPQDRVQLGAMLEKTAAEAADLATKLPEHVEGEVLIKVKPGMAFAAMQNLAGEYGAEVKHKFDIPKNLYQSFGGDLLQLKLPADMSTAQAIAAMEKDPRIAYACSNDVLQAYGSAEPVLPDDLNPKLWGLNNPNGIDIDAPEAWATVKGDRTHGPVIAVIDTGVDYNHPDLRHNMWTNPGEIAGDGIDNDGNGVVDDVHGINAIRDSGDPLDDHAHGTHCAGTIGAEGNNGVGVVGVQWEARIMGAKFLSASGSGTTADAIKATLYAANNGARITSNSWGGGGYNQALYDTLKASPCLHIFAAGNESNNNDSRPGYPASYDLPNIVSVAAIDKNGRLASFSNYGATSVDVAAPGVGIYSTIKNGSYASFDGTSMACPHVAGVAGLIATAYPDASNEEIKARLLDSVVPQDNLQGKVLTGGRINAANAVENDTTAPSTPAGLTATADGSRKVKLGWTAPGDDGMEGKARGYEIRYSSEPITNDEDFSTATPVESPPVAEAGAPQEVQVTVAPSGQDRTLHFAVRAYDNASNFSPVAVTQVNMPAGQVAFQDGGAASFDPQGTWAQVEVEGRGQVWTDSPDGNYDPNTNNSLVTKTFSLKGIKNPALVFDAKYSLEDGQDQVIVEAHNGHWYSWWNDQAVFTGNSDWKQHVLDLSGYDGDSVRIRFRLKSDSSSNQDGIYLDNLQVVGDPA